MNKNEDVILEIVEEAVRGVLEVVLGGIDDNMKLDTTKLESVEKYFEGNPINDIMDLNMQIASGVPIEEVKEEIIGKIEQYQEFLGGTAEEANKEDIEETVEEFTKRIVSDLSIESKTYKEQLQRGLVKAVNTLKDQAGRCEFYTDIECSDEGRGTIINGSNGSVTVTIAGKSYTSAEDEYEKMKLKQSRKYGESHTTAGDEYHKDSWHYQVDDGEYHTSVGDDYNYEDDNCPDCDCDCEDEELMEKEVEADEAILASIETRLNAKRELNAGDLELVKFYLKRQPYASALEIDSLSDRGLTLAWRQTQFIKNIG